MDAALIDLLRQDLTDAEYRGDRIRAALGSEAHEARERGVLAPARLALAERERTPLTALIRLLLLGDELPRREVDRALPALSSAGALALGLIVQSGDDAFRADLSLNAVRLPDPAAAGEEIEWWILSDLDDQLRRGPARPDHVMGVGGATRSLLAQAPLDGAAGVRLERALDLGTGCGVIALQLVRAGAGEVIATDISERALTLARANAALNGIAPDAIEFRRGSLFEPVVGERFDLILSNPPFVITPRGESDLPTYAYRDGGLAGDELVRVVVQRAPVHLSDDGTLLCLANWESPWGGNGLQRVREWIEAAAADADETTRLAAWVIERDRVSPVRYAETWVRDGGARPGDEVFERLMEGWLRDFSERRVTGIGLGSIRLRRLSSAGADSEPLVHAEQAAGAFAPQAGPELAAVFAAALACARLSDAEVLGRRWIRASSVAERREYEPGADSPRSITLHTSSPIERVVVADTLLAAAVGACDGELALGEIAGALAALLEVDASSVAEALCAGVRELVWLGMLHEAPR